MKIWHKPNEKPELNKYVIVRKHGFAQWKLFKFDNKTVFFEPATDDLWAYLKDIVEFATKVEQGENIYLVSIIPNKTNRKRVMVKNRKFRLQH